MAKQLKNKVIAMIMLLVCANQAFAQEAGNMVWKEKNVYFINYGMGVNTIYNNAKWAPDGVGLAAELSGGVWFNSYFGARLALNGISDKLNVKGRNVADKVLFAHMDGMVNALNFFGGKKERIWALSPFAGAGAMGSWAENSKSLNRELMVDGGMIATLHAGKNLDVNLEAGAFIAREAAWFGSGRFLTFPYANLGLGYNFGSKRVERQSTLVFNDKTEDDATGPQKFAVSTNVIDYLDRGTINLGVSLALSRHISGELQYRMNPFKSGSGDDIVLNQKTVYAIGARYWPWICFSGWWIKGGIQAENYVRQNYITAIYGDGLKRGTGFGASIGGGYSLMLSKSFNIDLGADIWGGIDTTAEGNKAFILPNNLYLCIAYVFGRKQ